MTFLIIIISLLVIGVVTRPFTTIVHELGHGIAALILTKENVTIYIGSFEDPSKSIGLKLGRLKFHFKYNPFLWSHGLCVPHINELSITKNLIITLGGPMASLLIGGGFFALSFVLDWHGAYKFTTVIFLASSLLDFFQSIIPDDRPIELHDGTIIYNDGQQLKQLFRIRKFNLDYEKGATLYNAKDYKSAARIFQKIINRNFKNDTVYRIAITSYLYINEQESALAIHQLLDENFVLNSTDFANIGLINSRKGKYKKSIDDFNKSLALDQNNIYALNNRGYTYNLMECYEKGITDFEKVLTLDSNFPYAYNNRGFAKIKLGMEEEGLKDIQKSLTIDRNNSYAYLNLGIYYLDKLSLNEALKNFNKAYNLDKGTHQIEWYLRRTQDKIAVMEKPSSLDE